MTTYYVSTSGSDTSNGTSPSTPWQTITHVNAQTFSPGDSVLFNGGNTFTGLLDLTWAGTTVSPITIGSYGTGTPTLTNGSGNAVYAQNVGGYVIENIAFTGTTGSTSYSGIQFFADGSGQLPALTISNCTATGWQYGINIGGNDSGDGYNGVTISGCTANSNVYAGIITFGATFNPSSPAYALQDVFIENCTTSNNTGSAAVTGSATGSGLILGSANGATIYGCVATGNGTDNGDTSNGPVGIWTYASNNVTIENCVSYQNASGTKSDGDGFDLDVDCTNCTIQYCVSYENYGAGILCWGGTADTFWGSTGSNTVRYNLCWGNGTNGAANSNFYGELTFGANLSNLFAYGNTCVARTSGSAQPPAVSLPTADTFSVVDLYNNILYCASTADVVVSDSAYTTSEAYFAGNLYWSTGTFGINWGGTGYSTLAAWRTAIGDETHSGNNIGRQANPLLLAPGTTPAVTSPSNLAPAYGLKVASNSPAAAQGLNIEALFSISPGTQDVFGDSLGFPLWIGAFQGLLIPPAGVPAGVPPRRQPRPLRGRAYRERGAPVPVGPYVITQGSQSSTFDYGWSTLNTSPTAPGATLVVLAGWDLSTSTTSAPMPAVNVTDSAGNLWRHVGTSSSSVTGSRSAAWVCVNAMPVTWVSVSLTVFASSLAWTLLEVGNMPAYYSLDVAAANAASGVGSLSVAPGNTGSADIAFAVLAASSTTLSVSTPSGWTALSTVPSGAGAGNPVEIFPYWIPSLSSGSSADVTWSPGGSNALSGVVFAINASPAGPVQDNPNMPVLKVEAAFSAVPGDPSQAPPSDGGLGLAWTDISARVMNRDGSAFISPSAGREYELSTPEAGELDIWLNNLDGAFTPNNTASIYYPGIAVGTPVRSSAYWGGRWYATGYGWAERWPQQWPDLPQWGLVPLKVTDAMAVLNAATMTSALQGDMLVDAPYMFIPASEQYLTFTNGLSSAGSLGSSEAADAGGLLAADISRTNQRTGTYVDGTTATASTGQTTNLLGEENTGFGASSVTTPPAIGSGPGIIYNDPNLPDPQDTSGVTVEFWLYIADPAAAADLEPVVFSAWGSASNYQVTHPSLQVQIASFNEANEIEIILNDGSGFAGTFVPSAAPQQIVITATTTGMSVYVNGALNAAVALAPDQTSAWQTVALGCPNFAYQSGDLVAGVFTAFDWAIYPYVLSTQRIESHYTTGSGGQEGSDATARLAQILSWANLGIARGGQVEFGTPGTEQDVAEGPAYGLSGSSAASAANQVALNETGMIAIAPTGSLVYFHKWALFNQSPVATFGDAPLVSAGEVPFLQAQSFDYDPTYLYDITQVTQQVGPNTTITASATSTASVAQYFTRSALQQTIQTTSAQDAFTQANWNLAFYDQPALRVKGVTINAASNPQVAFPTVLQLQQGQVVNLTRSPVGGVTISGTFLVQKIAHSIGPTAWETSLELSPYQLPSNVLALDTTGYNVLGTSALA